LIFRSIGFRSRRVPTRFFRPAPTITAFVIRALLRHFADCQNSYLS